MGSFRDKTDRFLVIDHSENYAFIACRSDEEVGFFVKSRKLEPDNFWVLNLADCTIVEEGLLFAQDYQFEKLTQGK